MLNRMVQTAPIVKAVEVSVPLLLNGMRTWFHNSASDANIVLYIVTFMEKLKALGKGGRGSPDYNPGDTEGGLGITYWHALTILATGADAKSEVISDTIN